MRVLWKVHISAGQYHNAEICYGNPSFVMIFCLEIDILPFVLTWLIYRRANFTVKLRFANFRFALRQLLWQPTYLETLIYIWQKGKAQSERGEIEEITKGGILLQDTIRDCSSRQLSSIGETLDLIIVFTLRESNVSFQCIALVIFRLWEFRYFLNWNFLNEPSITEKVFNCDWKSKRPNKNLFPSSTW